MEYKHLTFGLDAGVATITLNRPEVYNALNDQITYDLQNVLKRVRDDESVRVVVLTGNGKAFCSGQDLKDISQEGPVSFRETIEKRYNPIVRAIRGLSLPVICRLNGIAAGAGCSLALCCDIIVAAEEAVMTEAFVNIGLVPDSGSSYFLPRLVSMAKAFELCAMGSKITPREALEWGMINKVVPAAGLDSAVKAYTDYFSQAPTKAIGLIKQMLQKSLTSSLDEMLEYEAFCQEIAGRTSDHREGVRAFLEKRRPLFKGV